MATIVKTTFQFRRGTKDVWVKNNPVLERGEPGFEWDTFRLKVGDGATNWNDLPYVGENEWSISPDGNTLVLSKDNELMLYGFEEATTGSIPIKGADGKLNWLEVDFSSMTGYIDDLKQREAFVIYGGSASEVIG